jgi:hypothetical protein
VSIEEWLNGKMPLLPPLEHLLSAAFAGRRRPQAATARPDGDQPELPFKFVGGKAENGEEHSRLGSAGRGYPEPTAPIGRSRSRREDESPDAIFHWGIEDTFWEHSECRAVPTIPTVRGGPFAGAAGLGKAAALHSQNEGCQEPAL